MTTTNTESLSLAMEYDMPFPPAKVWRALTEPALVSKWLMATDMEARVGHHFTFRSPPMPGWDGIVQSEMLELEPEKRLRYSWKSGTGALAVDTIVTFTLTPTKDGGTKLGFEQTGFAADSPRAYNGAKYGWSKMAGEQLPQVLADLK